MDSSNHRLVHFTLVATYLALSLLSCKSIRTASDPKSFFENSRRLAATAAEQQYIGVVNNDCPGFFVANNAGRDYVISARHCVDYATDVWCGGGGVLHDPSEGKTRECVRIIASDEHHDIFMFEASGDPRRGPGLRLAGFAPPEGARLKLVGYPMDPYATGGVMTTENCWVHESLVDSPYKGSKYWDKGLRDASYTHNCSTYGGNSGGPMLLEHTDIAVGLPFTYTDGEFGNREFTDYAHGSMTADFVATHREALAEAGVTIVDRSPGNSRAREGAYFRASTYSSPTLNSCSFAVIPLYLTSDILTKIKVRFDCDGSKSDYVTYLCDGSRCEYNGSSISDIKVGGFTYHSVDGDKHEFRER